MPGYIDQVLTHDERVIHIGHISLWSMWLEILLGIVTLPLVIGVFILLWVLIKYKSTELAITNKRVITKFGFISRNTVEINMAKVESVQVHQSLWGRMFNFGTLIISGGGNPQAPIPGISQPLRFRQAFMEAQDATLP